MISSGTQIGGNPGPLQDPSSRNHGSEKWVPPIVVVTFQAFPAISHFHDYGRKRKFDTAKLAGNLFLFPDLQLGKYESHPFMVDVFSVSHVRLKVRELIQQDDISSPSGQFITTSAEVTPNGGLVRESPPKLP